MPNTQIYTNTDDKIGIIGQNIMVQGNSIASYYILESYNYGIMAEPGRSSVIGRLESMMKSISMKYPNVKLSILNVDKPTSVVDVKKNLIDTVRMWDPSYGEIPEIFADNIKKQVEEYCILRMQIDSNDLGDVDTMTTKQIVGSMISKAAQIFSYRKISLNFKKIKDIEESYYNIIANYGARASRELTFYTYISSLFPSYDITYNRNSYITRNSSPILGFVDQIVQSHFGYFTMENPGVEIFGHEMTKTYGSIVNINKFPPSINTDNFNLGIPNLRVNIELLPKKKAKLSIKRSRADLEFEQESAEQVGARDTDDLDENLELADIALEQLGRGNLLCNMSVSCLILGNDLKEVRAARQRIISQLADIDVIASQSLNQGADFINKYVKGTPGRYEHLVDLRVALSFQLNDSPIIGDGDSDLSAPKIGETI